MVQRPLVSTYRIGFALLSLVAVIVQFIIGSGNNPDFRVANFFSFFTIQSNIFAAAVFLITARLTAQQEATQTWALIRGGATAFITTTFIVYGLLLSGYQQELQTTEPWVDTVVHRVFPVAVMLDWVIVGSGVKLTFRQALIWMVYPLAYLVYSLVRGPIVDWYPYPFLNPDKVGGYAGVTAYAVGIAIGFAVITWLLVWLANRVNVRVEHLAPTSTSEA